MEIQKDNEQRSTTEQKIKEAARRVFTSKGYAATRTRDIAEESGYNLALINYYFRSKEKLFDIIMLENLQLFLHSVLGILNDPGTTLYGKIETVISHYIDMLLRTPDLPLFVLSEINANPEKLATGLGLKEVVHDDVVIVRQWKLMSESGELIAVNPIHILMNALSLTIFPFVASPLIRSRTRLSKEAFNSLMQERKKLIPVWVTGMIRNPAFEPPEKWLKMIIDN